MPWFTCGCLTTTGCTRKVELQSLASVYIQGTIPLTVCRLCSNSTSIGAGPDPSTSCSTFNTGVMVDFVCNGTSKSRSYRYFVDSRAEVEYIWSQNATSGPRGCWKLAVGSVAGRWTDTLWTKIDAEKFSSSHAWTKSLRYQFSFSLSKRNSHKQEDWNRLEVCS